MKLAHRMGEHHTWLLLALSVVLAATIQPLNQVASALDAPPYPGWISEALDEADGSGSMASGMLDPGQLPPSLTTRKFFQRWWWQYSQMAFPTGSIDLEGRLDAWRRMQAEEEANVGAPFASSILWTNIGPAPILNGDVQGRSYSGRLTDIAVDPCNVDHWFIAAADGGIWTSADAGTTWIPLTDDQPTLATGAVALSDGRPSCTGSLIIYAGTGDYNGLGGMGVLVSSDGGAMWQLRGEQTFLGARVHDIRVDPGNPAVVVAATTVGLYKSSDFGVSWGAPIIAGDVTDLEVNPADFQRQYAGVQGPSSVQGVYRTLDGWSSTAGIAGPWTDVERIGRVELAIASTNSNILYVGVNRGTNSQLQGVWRTDAAWAVPPPGGTAFSQLGLQFYNFHGDLVPHYCFPQCQYNNELHVDPADANILYAGGVSLVRCQYNSARKCACNSPQDCDWVDVTQAVTPGGIHVDQHTMASAGRCASGLASCSTNADCTAHGQSPPCSFRLLVGNDGGLWDSPDRGTTWVNHNTPSLSITQLYRGDLNPIDWRIALGGAQDNGSILRLTSDDGGWTAVLGGDGSDNFFALCNAGLAGCTPQNWFAVSTAVRGPVRSKDGVNCNAHESIPDTSGTLFIAPSERCPWNDEVVLTGANKLWKTTEFFSKGPCQSPTKSDYPQWTSAPSCVGASISAIAFARSDRSCRTFVYGSYNGLVYRSIDGGATCSIIGQGTPLPSRPLTDIEVNPFDPNTIYVTFSGQIAPDTGPGYLFKTANGGASWVDITPTVLGEPVNIPHDSVALDPRAPHHVYVGTDLGLFKSPDGGQSWTWFTYADHGLPRAIVNNLEAQRRTSSTQDPSLDRVVAFTFGRGTFQAPLDPGAICAGDCNGDGNVFGTEITKTLNVLGGALPPEACELADYDLDGAVFATEIVRAVNNLGLGCPVEGAGAASSSAAALGTATLDIGETAGQKGQDVNVGISMAGGGGNAAALQLDVIFDPAALSVPNPAAACVVEPAASGWVVATTLPDDPPPPTGRDRLRIFVGDLSHPITAANDGLIVSCTFHVDSNAPIGTTSLTGERQQVSDTLANPLPSATTSGAIQVCAGCTCT